MCQKAAERTWTGLCPPTPPLHTIPLYRGTHGDIRTHPRCDPTAFLALVRSPPARGVVALKGTKDPDFLQCVWMKEIQEMQAPLFLLVCKPSL